MKHICQYCKRTRDCGCKDCGESSKETCTDCNNTMILTLAEKLNISKESLGQDPLGGYHFK